MYIQKPVKNLRLHYVTVKEYINERSTHHNTPVPFDMNLDIYPNPFNSSTTLGYTLAERAEVRIELMDMTGRQIMEIANTSQASGKYTYTIDAASHNLKAGVYLVNILVNGNPITKRIVKVN